MSSVRAILPFSASCRVLVSVGFRFVFDACVVSVNRGVDAPIYLQNKTQIGKVDEIFGPINKYPSQHPVMTQLDNTTDIGDTEATFPDVEETIVGARVDSFEEVENIGSNEHRAERDGQWNLGGRPGGTATVESKSLLLSMSQML
ncbi:hypothetical protein GUJ93_ZPchr0007g3351 [Zizania palustris]|uniref:H/ACA ribonucleoprotein complex subunit n=1 Tax=Zizania palustris TaxID=103762 RepID=A0A8J5VZE7_ZIZPA|nr:hypothetical protein GUJ93_ZPchr0007g3351 [Zizania palustris]